MNRNLACLLALGLGLSLGARPAAAANFDGRWEAHIPAQGRCASASEMTLIVSGRDMAGEVHNSGRADPHRVTGQVQPDGEAAFQVDGHLSGTMKFKDDRFDATWNNGTCDRHAEGDRAPDDAQRAALVAQRNQHQDAYAELIKRADSGDKTLDYALLRAESVYAQDWDF
jgi:hypothetical protein